MRIVLDTNIFVSALLSAGGSPDQLIRILRKRDSGHILVTSDYQLEELIGVLQRNYFKERIQPNEIQSLREYIDLVALVFSDLPDVAHSPDPKDNPILATAIAGNADLIVSGDKSDMLSLGSVEGIPIVTVREALEKLGQQESI